MKYFPAILLTMAAAGYAAAQERVHVDVTNLDKSKTYTLEHNGSTWVVVPLTVITPGEVPTNPPTPSPETELEEIVTGATKSIPKSNANDVIAATIVNQCNDISQGLGDGSLDQPGAVTKWNELTATLETKPDWQNWVRDVKAKLDQMQKDDELDTDTKLAKAFDDISKGVLGAHAGEAGFEDIINAVGALLEAETFAEALAAILKLIEALG